MASNGDSGELLKKVPSHRALGRTGSTKKRRKGSLIAVLISDGKSTKYGVKMVRAFVSPETDELHYVTVIHREEDRISAEFRQKQYVEPDLECCTTTNVVLKGDDQTLAEALALHIARIGADLVIMSSSSLCNPLVAPPTQTSFRRDRTVSESAANNVPLTTSTTNAGGGGSGAPPLLLGSVGSIALRLLGELRVSNAPVLVVKPNSRGSFLATSAPQPTTPLRCMVDLQANSRHVLEWLFERLDPERDTISLAVASAYDTNNQVSQLAQRLITAFSVQASVNKFTCEKLLLKDTASKSLPAAVQEVETDILVIQAPRCKGLSPALTDLLYTARTSLLVWPAEHAASASPRGSSARVSSPAS